MPRPDPRRLGRGGSNARVRRLPDIVAGPPPRKVLKAALLSSRRPCNWATSMPRAPRTPGRGSLADTSSRCRRDTLLGTEVLRHSSVEKRAATPAPTDPWQWSNPRIRRACATLVLDRRQDDGSEGLTAGRPMPWHVNRSFRIGYSSASDPTRVRFVEPDLPRHPGVDTALFARIQEALSWPASKT